MMRSSGSLSSLDSNGSTGSRSGLTTRTPSQPFINVKQLFRLAMRNRIKIFCILLVWAFIIVTCITYWKMTNISRQLHQEMDLNAQLLTSKSDTKSNIDPLKMDPVTAYCNPPDVIEVRSEVLPKEIMSHNSLKLTNVMILIRHGDRGPLRPITGLQGVNCNPLNTSEPTTLSEDIGGIYESLRINKNVRSTVKFPYKWPLIPEGPVCHLGQLSVLGSVQHLKLGRELGRRYGRHLNLDEFEALTTPYQRTYQSAVSLLYGLMTHSFLPDVNSIPEASKIVKMIHSRVKQTDGFFFCLDREFCIPCEKISSLHSDIDSIRKDNVKDHPAVENLINEMIHIMTVKKEEGEETGAGMEASMDAKSTFSSPESVQDGLMGYHCHQHPFPCYQGKCINHADARRLTSFIHNFFTRLMKNEGFLLYQMLSIRGFLNALSKSFTKIQSSSYVSPFTLYSAHDLTVAATSISLGFFDGFIPPYASRISFEVYTKKGPYDIEEGSEEHLLRIVYNGKDVTRNCEICRSKDSYSSESVCQSFSGDPIEGSGETFTLIPLKEFSSFVIHRFTNLARTDNFEEACFNT